MRAPDRIDGDGVRLRPWRAGDVAAVEAVLDDPLVTRWAALADEGPEAWIARQRDRTDSVSLAITRAGEDVALGRVALGRHEPAARRAELSYWLVPPARGQGLALAAARALCAWAFARLPLDVVVLRIERGNEASLRLARRLGAVPVEGPPRTEADRAGVRRALVPHELRRPAALRPVDG